MNKADYEFVREEGQEDPIVHLSWRERFNVFGLVRLVFGYIRDSSGRPNNLLGLLYLYSAFFFVAIWWATHPSAVRHELDLTCDGRPSKRSPRFVPSPVKRPMDLKDRAKDASQKLRKMIAGKTIPRVQQESWSCSGASIKVQLTLPPPPALPSSFYWVLVMPILFLLGAYLARHPKMRAFLVRMMLAWRSVKVDDIGDISAKSLLGEATDMFAKHKPQQESTEKVQEKNDIVQQPEKTAVKGPSSESEREH